MKKMGFLFDASRCNGCRACVIACKEEKGCPDAVFLRQVKESADEVRWLSISCNHCENPACVAVCPVKAYTKEPDGLVIQDHAKCIGCGACKSACPYGAPGYSASEKKMFKCDGCAPRLQAGLPPACVAACGGKALQFGPIEELRAQYPKAVQVGQGWAGKVFGLPDGAKVQPSLVIVPCK